MKKNEQDQIRACKVFILETFAKIYRAGGRGIYTECFWKEAAAAGLYELGTYGGPMPTALGDLTDVEIVRDADGKFLYNVFVLKGGVEKK